MNYVLLVVSNAHVRSVIVISYYLIFSRSQILSLQKRLNDQFMVRRVLEKASGDSSFSHDATNENPMLKVLNSFHSPKKKGT